RRRPVPPPFATHPGVGAGVGLSVRRRDLVEELRDRTVVARGCDRLYVAGLAPEPKRHDAVRKRRFGRRNGHSHTISSRFGGRLSREPAWGKRRRAEGERRGRTRKRRSE